MSGRPQLCLRVNKKFPIISRPVASFTLKLLAGPLGVELDLMKLIDKSGSVTDKFPFFCFI